jgi:hypothetical protein
MCTAATPTSTSMPTVNAEPTPRATGAGMKIDVLGVMVAMGRGAAIYRIPWRNGKTEGAAQVAVKLPFAFRPGFSGNSYEFSKDLSTVIYARPGGQADLYLLSQE